MDLLERFESDGLEPETFSHEAHVYVAWRLIRRDGPARGGRRFARRLRRWTRLWGVEAKYHATITGAWLRLIAMRAPASGASWKAFRAANPDLLGGARALLCRHYSPARLDSARARRRFVEPDLRALGPPRRARRVLPIVAGLVAMVPGLVPWAAAHAAPAGARENTVAHGPMAAASSEFTVTGTIDEVFPLFDPLHEQAWAPDWKITPLAPHPFRVEQDAVFTTGHDHESVWTVVTYDLDAHLVEYIVVTPGQKVVRISVRCAAREAGHVGVAVTYRATPLSEAGAAQVRRYDEAFIQAWREPIQQALDAARMERP